MKNRLILAVVTVLAVAAALVPVATAARQTTQPAVQIKVNVVITDTGIRFDRLAARRGWGVHFIVKNAGKKPHKLDIGGLVTKVLKPGKSGMLLAALEERGRFAWKVTLNGTPKQTG